MAASAHEALNLVGGRLDFSGEENSGDPSETSTSETTTHFGGYGEQLQAQRALQQSIWECVGDHGSAQRSPELAMASFLALRPFSNRRGVSWAVSRSWRAQASCEGDEAGGGGAGQVSRERTESPRGRLAGVRRWPPSSCECVFPPGMQSDLSPGKVWS